MSGLEESMQQTIKSRLSRKNVFKTLIRLKITAMLKLIRLKVLSQALRNNSKNCNN